MKRILLPTDFSENALNAITYAIRLFEDEMCEFFLLHTYTPSIVSNNLLTNTSALSLHQVLQETTQKNIDTLKEELETAFSNDNHTFTAIASFNMLIPEMKNLLEKNNVNLVVMGTQGATGAKEIFLGTNTMYAIKSLTCPVLAVPSNFNFEAPKEILFPTDYAINKNNKYLQTILDLCSSNTSRLHILHAYYGTPLTTQQIENKAFLDTLFANVTQEFHKVEDTDVMGAVEKFQANTIINFMVMIHNKHNFLENILFKSVINQIVYHVKVPFLVIPAVERQ